MQSFVTTTTNPDSTEQISIKFKRFDLERNQAVFSFIVIDCPNTPEAVGYNVEVYHDDLKEVIKEFQEEGNTIKPL